MTTYNSELSLLCLVEQETGAGSTDYGVVPSLGDEIITVVASGGSAWTVVSTAIGGMGAFAADDFVGCLLECVSASTQNLGLRRKVVTFADGGAAATFTTDTWPDAVVATDVFLVIKRPTPYVACDAGAAATFADADRAIEANDYWNGTAAAGGPYMECVNSALVTTTAVRLVTDFVQAGGVFTAAAGANSTVGDLFELWSTPEEMSGTLFDCQVAPLKRGPTLGRYEPQPDARGQRTAEASLRFAFRGPGATTGGYDGHTEITRYLASPLALQAATGSLTAGAGGAINSVAFGAGVCTDGHAYITTQGDVWIATSGAATPAIPAPSLRTPEINGATIRELRTFWPADTYARLLAAKQYRGDGIMEEIYGIAPEFTIEGKLNDFLNINMACHGSDWYRTHTDKDGEITRAWRAKRPGISPVMMGGGRVVYLGAEFGLESFTVDLQQKALAKGAIGRPNNTAGWDLLRGAPTGQFVAKAAASTVRLIEDHISPYDTHGTAAANSFLIQCGTRIGRPGVLAFWAQSIQITNLQISGDEGVLTLTADWQVLDHDTDTTGLPPWLLAVG